MTLRMVLTHSAADAETAHTLAGFFEAALPDSELARCSSAPQPDGDNALRDALEAAEVVLGLLSRRALSEGLVPYQLGAAWALDKQLVVLLDPALAEGGLALPLRDAESCPLNADALMELAFSLASSAGLQTDLSHATRLTLSGLFPDWEGLDRQSGERLIDEAADQSRQGVRESQELPTASTVPSEHAATETAPGTTSDTQQLWPVGEDTRPEVLPSVPPPEPVAETQAGAEANADSSAIPQGNGSLPTRDQSFAAGRAMSDCVFHREQGGSFAGELDAPFGRFLSALGGNWQALRELEDLDLWMETADNVLQSLDRGDARLRYWYEMGFQLGTLLNLATEHDDPRSDEEARALWERAWQSFTGAAQEAGVGAAALAELEGMLDNLQGPQSERDYTLIGRLQARVRDLAQAS